MDAVAIAKTFTTLQNSKFDIFDVVCTTRGYFRAHKTSYTQNDAALGLRLPEPNTRVRIISITAQTLRAPLNITHTVMNQLFSSHKVEREFWDVLQCFGDPPHAAEGGCTYAFVKRRPDGSLACGYDTQYFERNNRMGQFVNPWSERHTGIYSRHSLNAQRSESDYDLVIMLHPSQKTGVEKRLQAFLGEHGEDQEWVNALGNEPERIHELLLETVLSNWRPFLRSQGDVFNETHDGLMTMTANAAGLDHQYLAFDTVQDFRQLRDYILTAEAYCKSNKAAVDLLTSIQLSSFDAPGFALQERARGYLNGLDALRSRIDNNLALLEYALGIKNQELGKSSNANMERLANITVEDSATMRKIGILGLFYVPGTFVSGLFGMNVFNFNDDTKYMEIATNFWIYAVLWAVFTGITYIIFVVSRFFPRNATMTGAGRTTLPSVASWKTRFGQMFATSGKRDSAMSQFTNKPYECEERVITHRVLHELVIPLSKPVLLLLLSLGRRTSLHQ